MTDDILRPDWVDTGSWKGKCQVENYVGRIHGGESETLPPDDSSAQIFPPMWYITSNLFQGAGGGKYTTPVVCFQRPLNNAFSDRQQWMRVVE